MIECETLAGFSTLPFLGNIGRENTFGLAHTEMELSSRYPTRCLVNRKSRARKGVWGEAIDHMGEKS